MGIEMGLWRADGDTLTRITPTGVGLEAQLESYIVSDPTMLGATLLIVGLAFIRRQHAIFIVAAPYSPDSRIYSAT